jgi:serine/threonine protein kinase
MALASGTRLGPYTITASIGAGGMGEVYRAIDTKLKRAVAIKVLPDTFVTDPSASPALSARLRRSTRAESSEHCWHLRA